MESKEDQAIHSFRSGLNCAQAILTAYSSEFNLNNDLALGISCGFGGGMGRLQETCGAVTGSFMVLGLYNSKKYSESRTRKGETYSMIQGFSNKFKLIHHTMDCRSLLQCDLNTEEGQRYFNDKNLSTIVCEKCIADSIRILEELMES